MTIEEQVAEFEPVIDETPANDDTGEKIGDNEDVKEAEKTSRDAIDRAFDAVDKMEAGENAGDDNTAKNKAAKPEGDADDDSGDTTKKTQSKNDAANKDDDKESFVVAPSRFSADAKKAWQDAPLPVRAEIDRAVKELEAGITGYQEKYKDIEPFEKLAAQHNIKLADQMQKYVDIDTMLSKDLVGGLAEICKNAGVNLQDVAAHVLKQPAQPQNQAAVQQNQVIQSLEAKIAQLEGQLTGVTTSIKSEQEAKTAKHIDDFADANPRFNELQDDILFFLDSGKAKTLEDAYALAERLNPAPASDEQGDNQSDAATAQTRKPQRSMTGSPANGSNPKTRRKSETTRDSLDAAFAKVGL